jgi:IS5 family transposase
MKLHIGVDSQTGLAHSAVVTPANVHDKHPLPDLLHGNEQRVYVDSAYASQKDLIHSAAPNAKDFTNQRTRRNGVVNEDLKARNRNKSKIRARVEHVFERGQAFVRIWQDALSRTGKECDPRIYGTRLGQHLPQPPAVDGTGAPIRASTGLNAHVKATRGH